MSVELILLTRKDNVPLPVWPLGPIHVVEPEVHNLLAFYARQLPSTFAEAWLFWDEDLGLPDPAAVQEALSGPADIWHAGLLLGTLGLPGMIDFVAPTWMLNRDPDPGMEVTSWRVSLRACLVRTEVLRQMGFINPAFRSLDAAVLEWAHRCIRLGVIIRHLPALLDRDLVKGMQPVSLSCEDELRFIRSRFGRTWMFWAGLRAMLTAYASPLAVFHAIACIRKEVFPGDPPPLIHRMDSRCTDPIPDNRKVSVLIPTIDRYPYLKTVLSQLRKQTYPPHEIIVIDQTPEQLRMEAPYEAFADLPLKVIFLDRAGQCISRNTGLQASMGGYILFIDDDDEIPPDLIASHLVHLDRQKARVSSGVALEDGLGDLPYGFTYPRISDVFPTNNSLLERSVLSHSGLFDLAYDRGAGADGDLGMRIYLSGSLMPLDPAIRVLHHHAPQGGLRKHKARVITYGGSRKSLVQRNLPSPTAIYQAKRYFSPRQVREMLWMAVLGTFSLHGARWRNVIKAGVSLLALPHTLWQVRQNRIAAEGMLERFPQIPGLPELPGP